MSGPERGDIGPATARAAMELLEAARDAMRSGGERLARLREHDIAEAERAYERATRTAKKRLDESLAAIEARYEQKIAAWSATEQRERTAMERSHGAALSAIKESVSSTIQKLRESLKEEVWLVETVFDAEERQAKSAYERAREQIGAMEDRLKQAEGEAEEHWRFYGAARPAADIGPVSGEPSMEEAEQAVGEAERAVTALGSLKSPQFAQRWALATLMTVLAVAGIAGGLALSAWDFGALAAGGGIIGAAIGLGVWALIRRTARAGIAGCGERAARALAAGTRAVAAISEGTDQRHKERSESIHARRDKDAGALRKKAEDREASLMASRVGKLAKVGQEHDEARSGLRTRLSTMRAVIEDARTAETAEAQREFESATHETASKHERVMESLGEQVQRIEEETRRETESKRAGAETIIGRLGVVDAALAPSWSALAEGAPPASAAPDWVRVGRVRFRPDGAEEEPSLDLAAPLGLTLPGGGSLVLEHTGEGRERAMRALRAATLRVLTTLPPGKVRLTIIDPVGLGQSFAGFMHLADYDDKLVNGRIWTEERHIEQRLADLTEHMEKVIQKYLRNEYASIDEYNARAGEIAEPYRFVVIADLPTGFSENSARRLASIISSGQRCGVYTLIVTNIHDSLPKGMDRSDLRRSGLTIRCEASCCSATDEVLKRHELLLDEPPDEQTLTRIVYRVGAAAVDASRVEVPFTLITPGVGNEWTKDSGSELSVPLGRTGATRLQHLTLGRGTAQHVLIAGKTGSGKSNLLHAIVTSASLWYGPDQVEMYLVDFKKGVEFKIYATGGLPHARAIAIESDREFALSVLQRVDAELRRRGERFRDAGVQDLAGFRGARPGEPMPRTLLLIDEFQEFFVQDDGLAQDASLLLDRLVRQGRAFGIHVLLGSQTLAGAYSLARSTMGQMAVRIALQCSEADSYLILGEDNGAARLLSRPGEAIYNDAGGAIEANSPFQIVFLPDRDRDGAVVRVAGVASERGTMGVEPPVVFEGNEPADLSRNGVLREMLGGLPRVGDRVAWLGDPVAIAPPTAATLRRQGGGNLLIVGQREESSRGLFASAMVSLAVQDRPGAKDNGALLFVLDSTATEDRDHGVLRGVADVIGARARVGDWTQAEAFVGLIAGELSRRQSKHVTDAPPVYLFVFGLHRLRMLRSRDEDFSFSAREDENAPVRVDKQFREIVTEGPGWGVHVIAWCDTLTMLERMMERSTVREFGMRVLFQMSVTDSTTLIDTPAASGLGANRAIYFSEDEGRVEKFRPYGAPGREFLDSVREALGGQ